MQTPQIQRTGYNKVGVLQQSAKAALDVVQVEEA
jgi:hypothetical protein